jgi:hypothetical protein
MRIQHKFEGMYDIYVIYYSEFRDMYDVLCRFLYRICGIDAIKFRLQVVKRNNF